MYQQDDRDIRAERAKQKLGAVCKTCHAAEHVCLVELLQPEQWLAIDEFAGENNSLYGSIRLTTRQTFQFHGVLKPNIKLMHQTLNSIGY